MYLLFLGKRDDGLIYFLVFAMAIHVLGDMAAQP